jgi:hypothetical protein
MMPPRLGNLTMLGWQELKAERNRRSLVRLTKALPPIFPRIVLARALARPFVPPMPRLAVESYWGAIQFEPIAWREHLRLAAERPMAGLGGWGTAGAAFRAPPAPYREAEHALGPGFCWVCGQPVYRLGWHVDLWNNGSNKNTVWHGSSGTRQVPRPDFGGVFKVGATLKPAAGCGGTPANSY